MAQRQKDEVRRAIVAAAADELASVGFEKATLAAIASRAGTSTGNLYRYFANKEELFDATIGVELTGTLRRLLERRVEALGSARSVSGLGPNHPYRTASEELQRFAFAHRSEVVFLLLRAEGTRFASFADDLVAELVRLALAYAKGAYPERRIGPRERRSLVRIYRGFLGAVASILAEETTLRGFEEATEQFSTYHLSGLRALFSRTSPSEERT